MYCHGLQYSYGTRQSYGEVAPSSNPDEKSILHARTDKGSKPPCNPAQPFRRVLGEKQRDACVATVYPSKTFSTPLTAQPHWWILGLKNGRLLSRQYSRALS